MAITLRRESQPKQEIQSWDPFREMQSLLRFDPFREMRPFFGNYTLPEVTFNPAFEVKETKDSFIFKADIPGVKEPDLDVSVTGDRLVISGKREEEKKEENETLYTWERSYGAFSRSFMLPQGVDTAHARAELKEGVLTLVLPKLPEVQPKKIAVKSEKVKA
ncbi:MAG: Hsp20/alpha crystallin family protein [Myxococcota bacterium]